MYDDAVAYFKDLKMGSVIVYPTDPAGQDYLTAVSDTNPAVSGIRFGSVGAIEEVDLTTNGPITADA
jgi:hypothetical protein